MPDKVGFDKIGVAAACLALLLCGCTADQGKRFLAGVTEKPVHNAFTHYLPHGLRGMADGFEKAGMPPSDTRPIRQAAADLAQSGSEGAKEPANYPVIPDSSPDRYAAYRMAYEAAQEDGKPLAIWIGAEWCEYCKKQRPAHEARYSHFAALDYDHDAALVQPLLLKAADGSAELPQLIIYTPCADGWTVLRVLPAPPVEKSILRQKPSAVLPSGRRKR